MTGNAPLLTGKYDQIYNNLASGNFDPQEEMKKLETLNRNMSKTRELKHQTLSKNEN